MPVIIVITATNFSSNGSSPLELRELDPSHLISLCEWQRLSECFFICLCGLEAGLMSALRFAVSLLKGDHRGSVRIHFAQAFSLKV